MRFFLIIFSLLFSAFVSGLDFQDVLLNYNDAPVEHTTNIWKRFMFGMNLKYPHNSKMYYYENQYLKNRKELMMILNSSIPYLYYILTQTDRYGMPSEIALIPAIESKFDPCAANPEDSYAGMWQLETATANRFHLFKSPLLYERRDIINSTTVAIKYLNYLYSIFLDWNLAIAAYNWGEGSILNAINQSKQKIGHVDYDKLQLRDITKDYLPKLVALADIISHHYYFHLKLPNIANKPYFKIYYLPQNTTINDIIEKFNINIHKFILLNPQLNNNLNLSLLADNRVLIPIDNNENN